MWMNRKNKNVSVNKYKKWLINKSKKVMMMNLRK